MLLGFSDYRTIRLTVHSFSILPKLRVVDVEFLGIKLRILHAFLLLPFIVAQDAERLRREQQNGDNVNPCHHPHTHVAQAPNNARLLEAAEENRTDEQDAQQGDDTPLVFLAVEDKAVALFSLDRIGYVKIFTLLRSGREVQGLI